MANITTPKLSRASPPVWSPYPGVSVLYTDPGSAALSGIEPLETSARARHGDLGLYDRLHDLAEEIDSARDVAFCKLPRHTYHVTLCDSVNQGTRSEVHREARDEITRTLHHLPDSLLWTTELLRLLRDRDLHWTVRSRPISFRVETLHVWGHVLVAGLEPADPASEAAKATHEACRADLVARLHTRLGVEVQAWRPHVTLGYFPNEDAAAQAREHELATWQERARERTGGVSVTFRSASVYGFTDMVSFWRLAH